MLLISVGSAITIKFGEDSNNIGWIGIDRLVENSNNLQSAINSLDNTTGTVQLGNDITLSSGVILWENVTFDMNGYTITPNSDFDIIQMKPGSTLCNGMINTVALGENGFNSSAILLDGSDDFGAEDIGTGNAVYYRTQIYNIGLYGWQDHGGTGLKNGTGIRFRSNNSGEFISFVNVHDIYFDGWSKSIYLECRGAAAAPYSYINGNMFSNIVMEDPHYGIHLYCENTTGNNIHANHFSNIQMQAGGWTKYGIRCDGDMNIFDNIEVWDINSVGDSGRYAVSFSSGSSENICSGNNEGGNISNTGTDNMFINRQNHTINYDGWTLENPYLNNAVLNYLQTTTTMVFNN